MEKAAVRAAPPGSTDPPSALDALRQSKLADREAFLASAARIGPTNGYSGRPRRARPHVGIGRQPLEITKDRTTFENLRSGRHAACLIRVRSLWCPPER